MKSIIIGLGNIGMNYDYSVSPKNKIQTHSQALNVSNFFELSGGVDIFSKQRKKFEKKFKKPSFNNIEKAMKIIKPSLVVISVPTSIHSKIFYKILKYSFVKVILCEKPIAKKYYLAKKMIEEAKRKKKILIINYFRNFEPGCREIIKNLKKKSIKKRFNIKIIYKKGLYNNASHYFDLLLNFMGKILKIEIISNKSFWKVFDPNPTFKVYFENGLADFLAKKNIKYCQMKIKSKSLNINYLNNGKLIKIKNYKNEKKIKSQFNFYQKFVYDNIESHLNKKTKLLIDMKKSLKLIKYLNTIENKIYG